MRLCRPASGLTSVVSHAVERDVVCTLRGLHSLRGGVHFDGDAFAGRRVGDTFEGARLIVGDLRPPIENSAFLVKGDRFARVGRAGEVQVPADAVRVDLSGKTVMPALIDLHSHIGYENAIAGTEAKENYTRENLIDHLRFAYTGHALTQSIGSDPPEDFIWQIRQESRFRGARFLTVGRGLAWPGTGPTEATRNDTRTLS